MPDKRYTNKEIIEKLENIEDKLANSESDNEIIEFLKYGINYSEKRISIVDNKASIMIAVLTLLFGLYIVIIKDLLLALGHPLITQASYIVLSIAFVIFAITIFYLLLTIRPSDHYLYGNIPIKDRNEGIENYVMWLDKKNDSLKNWKDYKRKINSFTLAEIKENYEKSHHICLQLIYNKYRFYPNATTGMKLLFLWISFSMLALVLILYFF